MGLDRHQLRYMALMALEDIADAARDRPFPRSTGLRFLLAWLFHESGRNPEKKWIFDSFWQTATAPLNNSHFGPYIRNRDLNSALSGITREVGWERTVSFEQAMMERRRKLAKPRMTKQE